MCDDWNNVILLSTDALRADHLSCYGYHRKTSPIIDKLASESICFRNAYSASSHTREAVPALLTGEYPDAAVDRGYRLATDSIASILSVEGFATGGFHSNPFVSRAYGFDRGFDTFDDDLHLGKHKLIALAQRAFDKLRNRHYARADEINERSLNWIDSLDNDQPFFLWNHYMDTHGPYEPPEGYATEYQDRRISKREAQSLYQRAIKKPDSITDEECELLIDLYDAEIRFNDEKIGVFLDELRNRNLLDESLLVFTADHGDAFGEHGYYEHPRQLHDVLTHVPLVLRHPEVTERCISTPVSTLDIVPTITEGLRGRQPTLPGISLFDVLSDTNEYVGRIVYSQARGEGPEQNRIRFRATNESGWCQIVRNLDSGTVVQDVGDDCAPDLKQALREHSRLRTTDVSPQNGQSGEREDVNGDIESRLEALGYRE